MLALRAANADNQEEDQGFADVSKLYNKYGTF